jgi:hypothetical protein
LKFIIMPSDLLPQANSANEAMLISAIKNVFL